MPVLAVEFDERGKQLLPLRIDWIPLKPQRGEPPFSFRVQQALVTFDSLI